MKFFIPGNYSDNVQKNAQWKKGDDKMYQKRVNGDQIFDRLLFSAGNITDRFLEYNLMLRIRNPLPE